MAKRLLCKSGNPWFRSHLYHVLQVHFDKPLHLHYRDDNNTKLVYRLVVKLTATVYMYSALNTQKCNINAKYCYLNVSE